MANVLTIASREFSDIVRSRRFTIIIIIFGLMIVISMVTMYIQATSMPDMSGFYMPRGFMEMMGYQLSGPLSAFAPVLGIALGCDTISGEREKGTLKIVLAQPVFRDMVINGKFLAATSAVSLAVLITSLTTVGASTIVLGVTPTAEEALKVALFLSFAVLYTMTFYGIAAFLSTILKKTSQSVILSVTLLAVFGFVIPVLANVIAFMIQPHISTFEPELQELEDRRRSYIHETIMSISPGHHFTKIGLYLFSQIGRIRPEEGSIMRCLMRAGPHVLALGIATVLVFIISYIVFTRQEVR